MGLLSPLSRIFVSAWKGVDETDVKRLEKLYNSFAEDELHPTNPDPGFPSLNLLCFFPFSHQKLNYQQSQCVHVSSLWSTITAPMIAALIETAKAPNLVSQGFINFEKRRDLYFIVQTYVRAQLEPSSVKVFDLS